MVSNNTLINNEYGINLQGSAYNTINKNTIRSCKKAGISFEDAGGNVVSRNSIINSSLGIRMSFNSRYITLVENEIIDNNYGLYCLNSRKNVIDNNTFTNNSYGIKTKYSYHNKIRNNMIENSQNAAISLELSAGNKIYGNSLINSSYGIFIQEGNGNKIYYNNFINNTIQAYSYCSKNIWDDGYPSGGNYWSNYTGSDSFSCTYQNVTGSDGIGDTPYVIDEKNQDNYPLMSPSSLFNAGIWNGKTYFVNVASNSTVSDFHFNPEETVKHFSFKVTGPDSTIGFFKLVFRENLLKGPYIVTVNGKEVIPTETTNDTHVFLYFTYKHSIKTVKVIGTEAISEFPSFLIMPLFTIATLLAVIVYKRKHSP